MMLFAIVSGGCKIPFAVILQSGIGGVVQRV